MLLATCKQNKQKNLLPLGIWQQVQNTRVMSEYAYPHYFAFKCEYVHSRTFVIKNEIEQNMTSKLAHGFET